MIEHLAADKVQLPRLELPDVKVTEPAGVEVGVDVSETVAASVVEPEVVILVGFAVIAVAVTSAVTVTAAVAVEIANVFVTPA